ASCKPDASAWHKARSTGCFSARTATAPAAATPDAMSQRRRELGAARLESNSQICAAEGRRLGSGASPRASDRRNRVGTDTRPRSGPVRLGHAWAARLDRADRADWAVEPD